VAHPKHRKMAGGGLQEERDRGSAMANRSLDGGPGNRRAHPLSDAAGQSVGIAALWEDGQNVGQRPGLWHHGAPVKTQTWSGTGGAIADWPPGPPSDAAGRSAEISVLFLVPYRGRLKWPHLHCRANAVV